MTVEIVILAMIAAFLGLRLYSVLGRRAEHEEEPIAGRLEGHAAPGARTNAPRQSSDSQPANPAARLQPLPVTTPGVERGLREIGGADRKFDAHAFVEGAKSAYRIILEAFWRGDKDELRQFCDEDVFNSFESAIDARTAAGETLDNRLIRIEETTLVDAEYRAPVARISLRFRSDIAAVTRDADGHVVAGSLDDAVEAIDIWTFTRNVQSADPDWILDTTDEG
ncbi:MAG: Tim44/TimA family putative adaptor protein [Novosphingobium sp.]